VAILVNLLAQLALPGPQILLGVGLGVLQDGVDLVPTGGRQNLYVPGTVASVTADVILAW